VHLAGGDAVDCGGFVHMAWVAELRCPSRLRSVKAFASIKLNGNDPWLGGAASAPDKNSYGGLHPKTETRKIGDTVH